MSLVPSYVYCNDGKFYQDLAYRSKTRDWFICFDDDDPIELVVRETCPKSPHEILAEVGIHYVAIGRPSRGDRVFGKNWRFHPAKGYFLKVRPGPFPAPRPWDTYDKIFTKQPDRQGVYYGIGVEDLR